MKFKFNSRNDGVHIPIRNSESLKQMMAFGKQESGALQKRMLLNLRIRSVEFVWKNHEGKTRFLFYELQRQKRAQKERNPFR